MPREYQHKNIGTYNRSKLMPAIHLLRQATQYTNIDRFI